MRLAYYTRHAGGQACRSAGLLGLGLLAVAVTCAAGRRHREDQQFNLLVGGLVAANALFVPAQLRMPGFAHRLVDRVRHVLDGMSVGICLLFAGWVLVIAPHGRIESRGFWIAVVTACALSHADRDALRASTARRAVLACAAAVAASVVGLSGLIVCVANGIDHGWPLYFASILLAAPVLALYGAMRAPVSR